VQKRKAIKTLLKFADKHFLLSLAIGLLEIEMLKELPEGKCTF